MCFCVLRLFFLYLDGDHRDLHVLTHSFPTRLSADLAAVYSAAATVLITWSMPASSSRGRWQAMRWPVAKRCSGGSCSSQMLPILRWQRPAKGQPASRSSTLGGLPSSTMRLDFTLGSATGTADSRAPVLIGSTSCRERVCQYV